MNLFVDDVSAWLELTACPPFSQTYRQTKKISPKNRFPFPVSVKHNNSIARQLEVRKVCNTKSFPSLDICVHSPHYLDIVASFERAFLTKPSSYVGLEIQWKEADEYCSRFAHTPHPATSYDFNVRRRHAGNNVHYSQRSGPIKIA